MPLASYDGAQMRVDEAGGITVPGLSVAQFGSDQFLTFGDPEANYGQVGYSTVSPGGFGVGRGTGTNAVGFFLLDDDTIYLSKSDYKVAIVPSAGAVVLQAGTMGGSAIVLEGTGAISLSGSVIQVGAGANRVMLDDETDTVTLQTGTGTPYITLDGNTGAVSLVGTLGGHQITAGKRLDCTGAILCIPQAAPTSPQAGDIYFDPGTSTLYAYNGTVWKSVALT